MTKINKLYIFDSFGVDKIFLDDTYNQVDLLKSMIYNWIPYFECHKCAKWDYCKYAKKHLINPNRSIDIKCGIAIDFLTNYINTTFNLISELAPNKIQSYFNAAYYLTQYVMASELQIGHFISKGYQEYLGDYAPMIFGQTKSLRKLLDKAHVEMKNLDFFRSYQSVLFVEGNSEEIFLNEMKKLHLADFLYLEVENYTGEGRILYDKIEHYFKTYQSKGYEIYLQTDLDGKEKNQNIEKIISKGLLSKEKIFSFKFDFETSIPIKILHLLLTQNNIIDDTLENFTKEYKNDCSVVKYFEKKYSKNFPKTLIAAKLAEKMYIDEHTWLHNEKFFKTELGQFIRFIQREIRFS